MVSEHISSLVWLRRDLRLHDNISLSSSLNIPGRVQVIFIFDTDILSRFTNLYDQRISFLADTLLSIAKTLAERGGELLIFQGNPKDIIPRLAEHLQVKHVFSGKDYEPYGKKRDLEIHSSLQKSGINFCLQNDHLIITPEEIIKPDGGPYKVFTPFCRAWLGKLSSTHIQYHRVEDEGRYAKASLSDNLQKLDLSKGADFLLKQIGYEYSPNPYFNIDSYKSHLVDFSENKIIDYETNRNFVYLNGTSKLSPYIRFGLISIRDCYREAADKIDSLTWINELVWRDFYASILHYFPDTINQEFLAQYRSLKWHSNEEFLTKWQQGLTGYPIVDAAMRQLNEEGWMHNRARMIVASFLTKHLLIDWRSGEEYFAQKLMDYDLASNVGGWQWAASVGTDAQPYYRIFNPLLQSEKFDPAGIYIKKYLPELRDIPLKFIHEPQKYIGKTNYPARIVVHEQARKRALEFFKNKE